MERLEEFAESEGISKSQAADRILDQGLDVRESDMKLVKVSADGGPSLNRQEKRLDHLEEQSTRIENQNVRQHKLNVWTTVALLWIGGDLIFGYPPLLAIVSGIGLVSVLVYSAVSKWKTDDE